MRALVTGGCGFIGSNLVRKLVDLGWRVDVVDDMSSGTLESLDGLTMKVVPGFLMQQFSETHEQNRKEGVVLVIESDIEHPIILERIRCGTYDRVFHLAANPRVLQSVENPAATTDVNCTRSLSLLESLRSCKSPVRFVFSSTCALYGDNVDLPISEEATPSPLSPYGLQKLFVEQYIGIAAKLHGIDAVSLRYFNVYGPGQRGDSAYATAITAWCNCVRNGTPLRSDGDGEQSRDMVYVGDVVRANVLAATRVEGFSGQVYNIGTGKRLTNNQVLNMFRKRFQDIVVNTALARPGDIRHTQADISLANRELGFSPQVSFEDGLERTWKWWGF